VGGWFDSNRAHFLTLNSVYVLIDPTIKNLIFDLGGVILDLSVDHTLEAFSQLFNLDKAKVKDRYLADTSFSLYEKGELTDAQFRVFVRERFATKASDAEIDTCWNAMLRGIPTMKLELLKELMKSYKVILLSNTNNIHLQYINEMIMPAFGHQSLDPFFHRTYYSHLMRMRKPDAEIFQKVLTDNNLKAEETLFLDDNELNIEGAKAVGIKTVHVTGAEMILEYFHA
jgi:epoxide hydrolase-like predicted phosphatase